MRRTLKMRMWLLVLIFISPILLHLLPWLQIETEIAAYAAEKNEVRLNTTEYTIGIHTPMSTYVFDFIDNSNMDADYSCESSNKKIVSITDKVQLIGVSKGTATITVTEKLGGVSRVLGKVKIKVVGGSLDKELNVGLSGNEKTVGFQFPINYKNYSATYTYQSSDPSMIEIDKYGSITTKKYNSAYVTVTEKYKGKVTKLGKIKVNIVKARPTYKKLTIPVDPDGYRIEELLVKYPNKKNTTYTFTSSNKKILDVDESSDNYLCSKKYGTVKITITEVNLSTKKQTVIGYTTVEIVPSYLDPKYNNGEVEYNNPQRLTDLLHFKTRMNFVATYSCKAADSSIISVSSKKEEILNETGGTYTAYYIKGIKKGKTKITVYEEFKGVKTEVGTINVVVKETIDTFEFYPGDFDFVDGMYSTTYYLDDDENILSNLADSILKEPYEDMSAVSFSSSDTNVIEIDKKGNVKAIAEGTAILKATCDDWSLELRVTVKR